MNTDLFDLLEEKIGKLIDKCQALQRENSTLQEENRRLLAEREGFKTRIDAILMKLEDM